jgi:hypothetical protein
MLYFHVEIEGIVAAVVPFGDAGFRGNLAIKAAIDRKLCGANTRQSMGRSFEAADTTMTQKRAAGRSAPSVIRRIPMRDFSASLRRRAMAASAEHLGIARYRVAGMRCFMAPRSGGLERLAQIAAISIYSTDKSS